MRVKQISIFMENRAGRLEEITGTLAKANIDIRAISLADTSDFGILRIIVDKPDDAIKTLREAGFTIRENDVIACVIPDKPGGLHDLLEYFSKQNISIEYMYGFYAKNLDQAVMVLRVEDAEAAINILKESHVEILKGEQVYSL